MTIDYDGLAAAYDGRFGWRDFAELERVLAGYVGWGDRVLEVGCGTGYWLERCARWGGSVTGLDASMAMLRRAAARGCEASLVRGRGESLPFVSASFDRLLVVQVLHHLEDPRAFAAEARRVLRAQGRLLVLALDPGAGDSPWYVYEYFEGTLARDRQRHPASSTLRRWLEEAGFVDCTTAPAGSVRVDAPARELIAEGGLSKDSCSQLSLLTDDVYRRGIERIEREIVEAEARGETLRLVAELHFYATSGTAPR